jgi:hypothetical protein
MSSLTPRDTTSLHSRVVVFRFPQWKEIFLFSTASITAMEPTQPRIQWVRRKTRLGREGDHTYVSKAETTVLTTNNNTNIHAPGRIRTHDPSKRATTYPRLRPHGRWDRRSFIYYEYKMYDRLDIDKAESVRESVCILRTSVCKYYQIGNVAVALWLSLCWCYFRKIIQVQYLHIKQTWDWKFSTEN